MQQPPTRAASSQSNNSDRWSRRQLCHCRCYSSCNHTNINILGNHLQELGQVDGILSFWDLSGPLVAKLCSALGLPGNPLAALEAARDKKVVLAANFTEAPSHCMNMKRVPPLCRAEDKGGHASSRPTNPGRLSHQLCSRQIQGSRICGLPCCPQARLGSWFCWGCAREQCSRA